MRSFLKSQITPISAATSIQEENYKNFCDSGSLKIIIHFGRLMELQSFLFVNVWQYQAFLNAMYVENWPKHLPKDTIDETSRRLWSVTLRGSDQQKL